MDTNSRKELEKLYGFAVSATATTHFYNEVYKYIAYVKQSHFLSNILEEDDKEMHIYDLEKSRTVPKRQEGESEHYQFVKEMRHMNSGEHFFVSHLYFLLTHHIYDLLDWYFTENFQSDEASIMLNGRKKYNAISRWWRHRNRHNIVGYDSTDYNKRYIDDFADWKKILINFHKLLMEKVNEVEVPATPQLVDTVILELKTNGYFKFFEKEGHLNPKTKEYKLLHMLVVNGKNPTHYSKIAEGIFGKSDSFSIRRDNIQQLVKKLKKQMNLKPSDKHKLIKSIPTYGYCLILKGEQRAITKP